MAAKETDHKALLRLPPELHAAAVVVANGKGISHNEFYVRAIQDAVDSALSAGQSGEGTAAYEAQVSFTLVGDDADVRAVQLGERLKRSAQGAGARQVVTRLVRIALLKAS